MNEPLSMRTHSIPARPRVLPPLPAAAHTSRARSFLSTGGDIFLGVFLDLFFRCLP